ncbi:MAG TPA: hypothetical protein VK639_03575 [Terriglobales bacterium]|nr:hypothetical protein [Terriglobales bacterium]
MRTFKYFILVIVLSCTGVAAQVSPTMPPPNRNITGPSRHLPPGADHPESTAGTIEGFVYWDVNTVRHMPMNSCSGLAITVSVGSSSGGPLTAYTPLGTLSNNFKYVGEVKAFLVGGKVNVYDVCTYAYDKVPVGPDLQVTLTVAQSGEFLPVAVPQFAILGPIKIINAQCNMLPRIVNPTASDLAAHWGSCQNMAYDVNFVMQGTPRPPLGLASPPPGSSGSQGGMLSSAPQQGMLSPGVTPDGTQTPSNPASQRMGIMPTDRPGSGGTVELNPQPFPHRQQLTNADVIRMVRAGITESVIVHSIQSSNKQFDFSPASIQALQQAHVGPAILAAMCDGSAHSCPQGLRNNTPATPGSKVELNPQPFPPRTSMTGQVNPGEQASLNPQPFPPKAKSGSPVQPALKPIKLSAPKSLRKVGNPLLSRPNASIIAVLQQQKQAAEQEASAMKPGIGSSAGVVNSRTPVASNVQGNALTQGLGPSNIQRAPVDLHSSLAYAPGFNTIVLTCTNDPSPRVLRVSGGEAPAVFTPEAKYNLYTITGCSFGQSQSGNSAYIYGMNGFKENLNIDFWSDNGITAHFDPYLAGVLDQDNVRLVVAPQGKQPFEKSGYKFYAARGMPGPDGNPQEVPLPYNSIPQSKIGLFNVANFASGIDSLPSSATSYFPNFSFQGTPVIGWVFRYSYEHNDQSDFATADCYINDTAFTNDSCFPFYDIGWKPTPNGEQLNTPWQLKSDTWDLSQLAPGFQISSYQLYVSTLDPASLCGAWDQFHFEAYLDGDWDFSLTPENQIVTTWPLYHCRINNLTTRENRANQSAYGLAVWVVGPRCVDAWTGQKDQTCMNKIKQILS